MVKTPPSAAGGVESIPDRDTKMLLVRSGQKKLTGCGEGRQRRHSSKIKESPPHPLVRLLFFKKRKISNVGKHGDPWRTASGNGK